MATAAEEKTSGFHWGAILGGSFVALGAWITLYALGAAIGISGTRGPPTAWTSIYVLVVPIIALFIGGLVAGRGEYVRNRYDAMLHAAVVWGFCSIFGTLVLGGLVGAVMGAMNVPVAFSWAIFGSLILSLIGAILGAGAGVKGHEHRHIEVTGPAERREVYP